MRDFQARVAQWMQDCFGPQIAADLVERGDRFLEEVFELLQSGGYDMARVTALRDYVWNRPVGEPSQEVGGVMVTLAAYCAAADLDLSNSALTELFRIAEPSVMEKIRAKQAGKQVGSALPIASPSPAWMPEEIFDGYAVGQMLTERQRTRTGANNVADVLDALARLIRANRVAASNPAQPEGKTA